MNPHEALAEGRLTEAVARQEVVVQADPTVAAPRLLLVELLTLAGRLTEARDQLRFLASDDPHWPAARRDFLHILMAEHRRSHRGARPEFLTEPPPHARARWNAWRAVRVGNPEAARWIDQADARSPLLQGHLDGREFDALRDTDDRFGSVLEVFLGPRYLWVPLEQVRRLRLLPAGGPLDLAFRLARLTLREGPERTVRVPVLYPGSHRADGVLATGQDTDWPETVGGVSCGLGSRVWMVGDEDLVLSECQQLDLV